MSNEIIDGKLTEVERTHKNIKDTSVAQELLPNQ